jgi:SAM-dependent methyltransferase
LAQYDTYFQFLKTRSRLALLYRRLWLYPRLSARLRGSVLDIGCGIGDMLESRHGTIGVDVNPRLVEYCRARGLEAYLMKPDELPFEGGRFDGVILDNVLEHILDPEPLLTEVRRVLRPKARVVVGVPGSYGYTLDPDHKHYYSEADLRARMNSAGFSPVLTLYAPFRSNFFDARLASYAIYGIYSKREGDLE